MTSTDLLQVCAWQPGEALTELKLTRYTLPAADHEQLRRWTESRFRDTKPRNPVLRGLTEILQLLVPNAAFVQEHRGTPTNPQPELQLFFHGHPPSTQAWQSQLKQALYAWLSIQHANQPVELRQAMAASALDRRHWESLSISTAMAEHAGICARPQNPLLFNALLAHAVKALAGSPLHFRHGHTRHLVPQAASPGISSGLELTAYPPTQKPGSSSHFWSEVITLTVATFPERPGLYLLARPSIRNWGPIHGMASRDDPTRHLDVFLSPQGDHDLPPRSHAVLGFTPKKHPETGERHAAWIHHDSLRLVELLPNLTGSAMPQDDALLTPTVHGEGLITLPRLGNRHQDKNLPGGTGVGWVDRADISRSLAKTLSSAGFQQEKPLHRLKLRQRMAKPRSHLSDHEQRQLKVVKVLDCLQLPNRTLEFLLYQQEDDSIKLLENALVGYFGPPSHHAGTSLHWETTGLCIRIEANAAGPLSEQIPHASVDETSAAALSKEQIKAKRQALQHQINGAVESAMQRHVQGTRPDTTWMACGILEMQSSLADRPDADPFTLARQVLAHHNILPQVILVEIEDQSKSNTSTRAEKYNMALRDCFRMLGVLPTEELPGNYHLAALSVSRKNQLSMGRRRYASLASPLALHIKDGIMRCALPSPYGDPEWMSYAEALLRVLQGEFGHFDRKTNQQAQQKYGIFFRQALEQIDQHGPALVLINAPSIKQAWPSIQNQHLRFDHLNVNNHTLQPDNLPNTRIIRWNADPQHMPPHYHEGKAKDVSGIFGWGEAKRTFYALKTSPLTQKNLKWSTVQSRHGDALVGGKSPHAIQKAPRQLRQLDEICVMFCQPDDQPDTLALLAHRLRKCHVQYHDDTTLPFPLHELGLLGDNIRAAVASKQS